MAEGKCGLCKDVIGFHEGIIGKNADNSKILFVLNCPDKRILQPSLKGFNDYKTALFNTKTGSELDRILKFSNMTIEDIFLTNIFKCVFKSNKNPSDREYNLCYDNHFKKQIAEFNPKKMVLFGGASYNVMFPKQADMYIHDEAIGKVAFYNSIPSLIMPHPSRIWAYRNREKIEKCRQVINNFLKIK